MIVTPLEIKGAMAGLITSGFILATTFIAGGIYRSHLAKEQSVGNAPLTPENLAARGRVFSFKAVLIAMVKTRMGARMRRAS